MFRPQCVDLGRDHVPGNVEPTEYAGEDFDRCFELLGNHLVGAKTIEVLDLRHVMRSHDDRCTVVHPTCQPNDGARRRRVTNRDDDRRRTRRVGTQQDMPPRRISIQDRMSRAPRGSHRRTVEFNEAIRNARLGQYPRQVPAVESVADDHNVPRARQPAAFSTVF